MKQVLCAAVQILQSKSHYPAHALGRACCSAAAAKKLDVRMPAITAAASGGVRACRAAQTERAEGPGLWAL